MTKDKIEALQRVKSTCRFTRPMEEIIEDLPEMEDWIRGKYDGTKKCFSYIDSLIEKNPSKNPDVYDITLDLDMFVPAEPLSSSKADRDYYDGYCTAIVEIKSYIKSTYR